MKATDGAELYNMAVKSERSITPEAKNSFPMNITTLLADPSAISLNYIRSSLNTITLVVKTNASQAICPRCHRSSIRVHSRYIRRVADLPWHGIAVKLELHTRRFRCLNSLCPQRIFCERLPRVVAHYARQTVGAGVDRVRHWR